MYPPGQDRPAIAAKGDTIEHKLMPGFAMTVQDQRWCPADNARPERHDAFKITDPDGNTDWLCAYDVVNVSQSAGHTATLTSTHAARQGDPGED